MKRRRRWFNHPLIIIPPLVIALAIVWQQHTLSGRSLNVPLQNANLLSVVNSSVPAQTGLQTGWSLTHAGDSIAHAARVGGYVSSDATAVTVDQYKTGDITLSTPQISVDPNKTYLFKGYYTTDIPFSLVVRYIYTDGSDKLSFVQNYQAQKGTWSTVSHAFKPDNHIAEIQYIFKLASAGHLTVDGVYLERRDNIYLSPATTSGTNLIPNSALAASDIDMPDNWVTYHSGDNQVSFTSANDSNGSYLQATVNDYKNGEAKWQYDSQPVKPQERYNFTAAYRSNTETHLVAEYERTDGSREFITLDDLPPASEWTNVQYTLEVPERDVSLNISFILQDNGTLESRNYSLTNITKSGPIAWKRPIISITFDDGWRSTYLNAVPVLERYGYKATFYINPSSIETPGFMYADDLSNLGKQYEIAAHGYDHKDMTAISTNALDEQLKQGKDYLSSAGFTITDFAPPYGKSDPEVEWLTRKYFTTSRSTATGINTRQNLNAYNLKTLYLEFNTPPEVVARALGEVAAANGWLILVYHNVGAAEHSSFPSEEPRTSTVATEAFTNHMAQVQKSGIAVLPVDAAYAEVAKQ